MKVFPKKAMLLAAGLGTRMREVTVSLPKPLVEVCGKALVDYNLELLQRAGVEEVVVNISHLGHLIEAHLASHAGMKITLSHEEVPLETGGGIRAALPLLGDDPFFVLNSDTILLDGYLPALHRLAAAFDAKKMDAALLVHPSHKAIGYLGQGDFMLDGHGRARRRRETEVAPFIYAGVQLIHPDLFADAPEGAFSINRVYNARRDAEGWFTRLVALPHDGEWLHVGEKSGLIRAERFIRR